MSSTFGDHHQLHIGFRIPGAKKIEVLGPVCTDSEEPKDVEPMEVPIWCEATRNRGQKQGKSWRPKAKIGKNLSNLLEKYT